MALGFFLVHDGLARQGRTAQRIQLELEWLVGDDPSNIFLDDPRIVVFGANGSILLTERDRNVLRRFDAPGIEQKPLGGPGRGPGEFTRIVSLLRLPGDSLWVYDIGNGKVTTFDATGRLRGSMSMSLLGGKAFEIVGSQLDSNNWVILKGPGVPGGPPGPLIHLYAPTSDTIVGSNVYPGAMVNMTDPINTFRAHSSEHYRAEVIPGPKGSMFVVAAAELYPGQVAVVPITTEGLGSPFSMSVPQGLRNEVGRVVEGPADFKKGSKARGATLHIAGVGKQSSIINVWDTRVVALPGYDFGVAFVFAATDRQISFMDVFDPATGFQQRFELTLPAGIANGPLSVWDSDEAGRLLISYRDPEGNPVLAVTKPWSR